MPSIWLSIAGLILSALGAIGGFLWLADRIKRLVRDRAFRQLFPGNDEILIVLPTQGGLAASPNTYTTVEDSLAQAAIQMAFTQYGRAHSLKLHTAVTSADLAKNLFLVCGVVGNSVMNTLHNTAPLEFLFQRDSVGNWVIGARDGRQVSPPSAAPSVDYAIIGVTRNPWAPSHAPTRVYFSAGIHGLGTWAATAQFVSRPSELVRHLRAHGVSPKRGFEAVVSAREAGWHTPSTSIMEAAPLVT